MKKHLFRAYADVLVDLLTAPDGRDDEIPTTATQLRKFYFLLLLGFSFWLAGCMPSASSTTDNTPPSAESQLILAETTLPDPTVTMASTPKSVIEPELTATVTPSPTKSDLTPTPSPTKQFPGVRRQFALNNDYNVVWSVPVNWQEISLAAPSTDAVFWQAWSNESEVASEQYPVGQMTLTMFVEPAVNPAEQPEGTEQLTIWQHFVWTQEIMGMELDSFDLRLSLVKIRQPYRYNYRLDCTHSEEMDATEQSTFEALCRHTWHSLFRSFGLCAVPMEQQASTPGEWQSVSDEGNQYFFLIPAGWLIRRGPTPDRLQILSDPTAESQPNICPLPNGIMSLDFAVDRPGNFGTGAPGSGPNIEGFTERTVANRPAWLQTVEDEELMGPFATATLVYIQGPEFWYTFLYSCTPPTDSDPESQSAFKAQCEDMLSQILDSFQIVEP